jgi:hypothetical protein
MKSKRVAWLVIFAFCCAFMSPLLTPASAQAATMNDLVNEMNLVYNCIDDTYTDGSGKTDKDYMSIARQNAQNLALEAYDSANWNAILNPLMNSQVLAKAGQDDATVRQTFVNAFADLSEVYYISDAAELETRLTTFKNTYRDFFLALFGNDITIDKFAGFLSATRDDFRNAINHSLTTEESNLLDGKSLKEAALYGTNQELTNAMPILMKYAMRNVIEAPGSQYADFDQRLGDIGWSVDLLIAQFKELNSKVDPDNKAQLALALASVRSQSKVYDLTGATPTTPITNNAISCNVNDTFSIQLKIMDTDLTGQVDYVIVGANPEAIEITGDQGTTIDFKAASAGSATLVLYRQDGTVPQHDWIAQLTVTVNITPPSTNNSLNALVLRSGTTVIAITPAFAAGTTAYEAQVGNAIASVTVTPTIADATAAVTVNGAAVPSGQASGAINLANTGNTPNAITVVVTAQSGATKTYTINVFRAKLETPGATDTVTVPADTPVTVDAAQGAKIDVDETQALPLIEVNTADSTVGTIQVSIPAGTTVSGPAGWTGEINLPKVVTVPLSDVTGAGSVAYAIEVGTGDTSLIFSQAVRILMPGAKGKRVGVISGGVFNEITTVMAADTQAAGNALASHGKIEVGNDVAIWTKHFTKFVVYTPATTPPTSGGGGGGGGGATPFNGTSVTAADGGTVSNSSLGASVVIPAKAMASNFKVRVEKASTTGLVVPDNSKIVGDVVEILKDESANFSKAVTVKLSFDKSKVDLDENTLSLYWYNTSTKKWVELDNVKVDAEAGKVSGEVKNFAKFAILATTKEAPVKPDQPKPETPKVTLTDISGHWAQADIQKLVAAGAISGYPNKTFKPNNNITRAEFAVTLVKALKLAPKSGKVFNDTAKHWAKDSIATAQAYGIISGYSDTKFGPNDNITREQMAVMITKAASLKAAANAKTFTDSAKVSAWAKDAVIAASSNGIISGYPDGSFKPKANATRAEAATMIVKIMK